MPKVLLFTDELFEKHQTGAHPESPRRLEACRKMLRETGLQSRCTAGTLRSASTEELTRIHAAAHIDRVGELAREGGGRLDPDTVVSPESETVARSAAGTALAAVDHVLEADTETRRALCLVRPPGHHALATRAMGFCLYNNIALAAAHAREAHGLSRVLIVDFDVHHGNGTQDVFYADGNVHFLSLHRWPFYPGTGAQDETGTGDGVGATWNVPLQYGISRRDYLAAFDRTLELAASRCRPELVLISAGFDAHAADPIGDLGLESEDFGTLTQRICEVAESWCDGRVVSLLEGGYHVDRLAESVQAHLETLLDHA